MVKFNFTSKTATALGLGFAILTSVGCAGFSDVRKSKKFVINRAWTRHTIRGEYLGARISHVMPPVIFGNLIISGNEIDSLSAYDLKTGQVRWSRNFSGGVVAAIKESQGVLYLGAGDGNFYALSADSGQTKWSYPLKAEAIGAPLVTEDTVYFLAGNNAAYALKKNTGEQVWYYSRVDTANITVRGGSEPSIVGDKLLLGFSDGYLVALDRAKGTWIWERQLGVSPRFRDVDSKPVVDAGRIYVSSYDGQLFCLSSDSGQTIWTSDEGGFTPVTINGDRVYYSTSTRKLMALEKSSGRIIWSVDLSTQVASQPQLARGLVIIGEWGGQIKAFDARNGKLVTSYNTGRGATSKITISENGQNLFVMTADANLFALKLELQGNEDKWPWEL